MLATLSLVLSVLLASESTLSNGLRVNELPADSTFFQVIAGYRAGIRNEIAGTSGLSAAAASFLFSSRSARELAIAAYGAGGELEFFSDLDVTGFRLKVPAWARPMLEGAVSGFFTEAPARDATAVVRALENARSRAEMAPDEEFRAGVEDEIRIALLGFHPYTNRPGGSESDLTQISTEQLVQFFASNYGTDRAFVVMTGPPMDDLGQVPARMSQALKGIPTGGLKADRTLRFSSDLAAGAVIFASPVPSVYYEGWYAVLLLDRLIGRLVPGNPATRIVPAVGSYYYRLEVPVPAGQFAEPVQETLLQEIERLQLVRPAAEDLEAARTGAIEYLESDAVKRWFLSLGIPEQREAGIGLIQSFSADDMRATARDLLISNRVVASWSAKPQQLTVEVESLGEQQIPAVSSLPAETPELAPLPLRPFPSHTDPPFFEDVPQRLASGVTVVGGSAHAIFVAPDSLKIFEQEPGRDVIQSYSAYRPDRILVMAPRASLDAVKPAWSVFQGNAQDRTTSLSLGSVGSGDIPALCVLKVMLDRKLIEAGLWNEVDLGITAARGSMLTIEGSAAGRQRVLDWIREIASRQPTDAEMEWAREAAVHRLDTMLPDLQSLIWQSNPQGFLLNIRFVLAGHIQDVARIHFQ